METKTTQKNSEACAGLAAATGSPAPPRCRVQLVRQEFMVQIGMGKYRSAISVMNDRRDVIAVLSAALDRGMDFLHVAVETHQVEWPEDWPKLEPENSVLADTNHETKQHK